MIGTDILLVDTDEDYREALAKRLRRRGAVVDTARCVPEALHRIGGGAYTALLVDIESLASGEDGAVRVPGEEGGAPILLLAEEKDYIKCSQALRLGVRGAVAKPVDIDELRSMIEMLRPQKDTVAGRNMKERAGKPLPEGALPL